MPKSRPTKSRTNPMGARLYGLRQAFGRGADRSSPEPPRLSEPTFDESRIVGQKARKDVPLESHAEFTRDAKRVDPLEVLASQARMRLFEVVPVMYGRMSESPASFFRGSAAIMARDLAGTPSSGIAVQCAGDAALTNFGIFASPEHRLVFDLADFDETFPGRWEWDVKRLITSIVIAGKTMDLKRKERERVALETAAAYRTAMSEFAGMSTLDIWYARFDLDPVLEIHAEQFTHRTGDGRKARRRARTHENTGALSELIEIVDGQARIADHSPQIVPIDKLLDGAERERTLEYLESVVNSYRETLPIERLALFDHFTLVDLARKVTGVSGVGMETWIGLLVGADGEEPLFLQFKQADESPLEPFVEVEDFQNHGERIVVGQRLLQADSDIFLGSMRAETGAGVEKDYYVRQLPDWCGSVELDQFDVEALSEYGRICAWTLARAHARTGDRVAIASYLGEDATFDHAVVEFARAYAKQTKTDHAKLAAAAETGQIVVNDEL